MLFAALAGFANGAAVFLKYANAAVPMNRIPRPRPRPRPSPSRRESSSELGNGVVRGAVGALVVEA
jgi:hypothetical protein